MEVTYTVIRSSRKTMALQIREDGQILVRAPHRVTLRQIQAFVSSHTDWIANAQQKMQRRREQLDSHLQKITEAERREGVKSAMQCIPQRVQYFAQRMGVDYGRITIREQKTRWGSCSSAGNLNFNWKLVLLSPDLLDYVVVHELAHRREMNHSKEFWAIVAQELPDWKERRSRLREYCL